MPKLRLREGGRASDLSLVQGGFVISSQSGEESTLLEARDSWNTWFIQENSGMNDVWRPVRRGLAIRVPHASSPLAVGLAVTA
jgi:hypothetical protein